MVLVDTNVLYALADRRDKHHARCAEWLQRTPDVLMVPATVLAETCYLIDRTLGPIVVAAVAGFQLVTQPVDGFKNEARSKTPTS